MHWKSSEGYINVRSMTDKHLGCAWALVLSKIEINSKLPVELVAAAGLDLYDEEPLEEIAEGFSREWERRVKERECGKVNDNIPQKEYPVYCTNPYR